MAKLVFEKSKSFLEKALKEKDTSESEYEKCLSEIELAMENCQIKVSQNFQICMEFFPKKPIFAFDLIIATTLVCTFVIAIFFHFRAFTKSSKSKEKAWDVLLWKTLRLER